MYQTSVSYGCTQTRHNPPAANVHRGGGDLRRDAARRSNHHESGADRNTLGWHPSAVETWLPEPGRGYQPSAWHHCADRPPPLSRIPIRASQETKHSIVSIWPESVGARLERVFAAKHSEGLARISGKC